MRATRALICLAVVVAACAANPQSPRPITGEKLYEAVASGKQPMLAVIDSRSHNADRKLALGAPSADWKHVYTTAGTSLVDTATATGDTVNTMQLHGAYHLPAATANGVPGGLSPSGRWLVVERFDGSAQTPSATHMLVIDTAAMKVQRRVDLQGYFEFDAIDNMALNLYLIQHLNGREYYVRLYDLTSGSLTSNIVVDKSDGNQAMAGLRLSGVPSADGHWLFSVYVREHEAPFIHALSLDGPFAFCLDLPGRGYADDPAEMQWSLAMSPDGSRVYAVNTATGDLAVMTNGSNGAPTIDRTARFARSASNAGPTQGANGAVVSGGTLIAGGPAGLTWIDTSSLKVVDRSIAGWSIPSVGLSPDGKHLYAVSAEGRIAQVTIDSRAVDGIFDPSAGTPMALMRVAAA